MDISGVYQLGSARKSFENQRKISQAIMEQVGQQKTRNRLGGTNKAIGEQVIGGTERSESECC